MLIEPVFHKGSIENWDEIDAQRKAMDAALTRIRTENLSRFDCTLLAAEVQGQIQRKR